MVRSLMLDNEGLKALKREYINDIARWIMGNLEHAYSFRLTGADDIVHLGGVRDEVSQWDCRDVCFYIGTPGSIGSYIIRIILQFTIEETDDRRDLLWCDVTIFSENGGETFIHKTLYDKETLDCLMIALEDKMGRSVF